jgi:hypothetical protein
MIGNGIRRPRAAAFVALAVWLATSTQASTAETNGDSREASAVYRAARLSQARQDLAEALANLEAYLERGDNENAKAWKQWLGWEELVNEVKGASPDHSVLLRFEGELRQNVRGLEHESFQRLRRALKAYAVHVELAQSPNPASLYAERRHEATQQAAELGATPPHADADACGRLLEWIRLANGDEAGLVQEVRRAYAAPNATARVSRRFLDFVARRTIEDVQVFAGMSQGALSVGNAVTSANVGVRLVPTGSAASVDLKLDGTVSMPDTVSTRRRVSVFSSADVAINAHKRVTLTDQGIRTDPASASTLADLQINGVSAPLRIVERTAWRRANQLRPQAAADASQRVADEIESQADELSSEFLTNAQRIYCDEVRSPLIRLDAMPERLEFSTTSEYLLLVLLQRSSSQLSAPQTALPFTDRDDLAARVHESFFNNVASDLLAGQTVRDRAWLELMNLVTGRPPRALWVHDRSTPWSVTFAEQLPLSTRMVEGQIGIVMRFSSVRWGDETWTTPIRVEAIFEPRATRDGPALIRTGDLEVYVEAPESSDNTTSATRLRRMLSRRFGAVLPAELYFDGLVPPTGGGLAKLRSLAVRDFYTEKGWLVIGYELDPHAGVTTRDALLTKNR